MHKTAGFEGSPLYLFLLDELVSLDKLDVLGLPDDFKYHNEPFFMYYQSRLVENLNRFRVNKNFRKESLTRLKMAPVGRFAATGRHRGRQIPELYQIGRFLSVQFPYSRQVQLCRHPAVLPVAGPLPGIATVPYPTGVVRFSLGGYISAGKEG